MDYTDELLFHYKTPQNTDPLENPSVSIDESNPVCGDDIHLELEIKDGAITNISHKTTGCAICTASMSILSDELIGKSLKEVKKLTNEDIFEILGIDISPGRVKCALLSLVSTKKAILTFENPELKGNNESNSIKCSH